MKGSWMNFQSGLKVSKKDELIFHRQKTPGMKRIGIGFILMMCLLVAGSVQAQDYKGALGVRFSSKAALINTSVSLKYFFTEKTAAEGFISLSDPFALGLLLEQHQPFVSGIKYYYGGGIYAGFSGDRKFGFHGVIGLDYKIPNLPIGFSIDWKPELTVAKEFSFEARALGATARFTIK